MSTACPCPHLTIVCFRHHHHHCQSASSFAIAIAIAITLAQLPHTLSQDPCGINPPFEYTGNRGIKPLKPLNTLIHRDRYPYPSPGVRVLTGTGTGREKNPWVTRAIHYAQVQAAEDMNHPNSSSATRSSMHTPLCIDCSPHVACIAHMLSLVGA